MRVALIGYGSVARAFAELLKQRRHQFPFRVTGVLTRSHGACYGDPLVLPFEPAPRDIGEFLDRADPEVLIELSSLNPESGEPALTHIRVAFSRGIHVVTANKGPIAHAYRSLQGEAFACNVQFRFESTVIDGTPVFNMVRNCLPGVRILGFSGALNSTTKVILASMEQGRTLPQGIVEAQFLGITETDPSYDVDGWDSAVKTAALANVLMDAGVTPADVVREGIRGLSPADVQAARDRGEVYVLVSRAAYKPGGQVVMSVQPELLKRTDPLATTQGTTNILLLHTDLMGTIGTISIEPGVAQTAYGILSDLVDIAKVI